KLDLLRQHGFKGLVEREKTGYYPKGGGKAVFEIDNYSLKTIDLTERGEIKKFEIFSRASRELEDREVADRQADELRRKLKNSHISVPVEKNVEYEKTASPGSSLVLKAVYENSIAGFDALGERGKRSEEVAKEVVEDFRSFHSTEAAVDKHMADQLMVFMALTGGKIAIPELTDHVKTNSGVIEKFGAEIDMFRDKGFSTVMFGG
ncbi:MAG: RNA 3'-terminal phosphate cyclase, partial [Candidatus Aenigmatarchaeota archaeon]